MEATGTEALLEVSDGEEERCLVECVGCHEDDEAKQCGRGADRGKNGEEAEGSQGGGSEDGLQVVFACGTQDGSGHC